MARTDQKFIIEENLQTKIFRKYAVAKEMYNSAIDPTLKDKWYRSMNNWAAKILDDDQEEFIPTRTNDVAVSRNKSTPVTAEIPTARLATHSLVSQSYSSESHQQPKSNENSAGKKINSNDLISKRVKDDSSSSVIRWEWIIQRRGC